MRRKLGQTRHSCRQTLHDIGQVDFLLTRSATPNGRLECTVEPGQDLAVASYGSEKSTAYIGGARPSGCASGPGLYSGTCHGLGDGMVVG